MRYEDLREGQLVVIARHWGSYEGGWGNRWVEEMANYLGRECFVVSMANAGVRLKCAKTDTSLSFSWPWQSLDLVGFTNHRPPVHLMEEFAAYATHPSERYVRTYWTELALGAAFTSIHLQRMEDREAEQARLARRMRCERAHDRLMYRCFRATQVPRFEYWTAYTAEARERRRDVAMVVAGVIASVRKMGDDEAYDSDVAEQAFAVLDLHRSNVAIKDAIIRALNLAGISVQRCACCGEYFDLDQEEWLDTNQGDVCSSCGGEYVWSEMQATYIYDESAVGYYDNWGDWNSGDCSGVVELLWASSHLSRYDDRFVTDEFYEDLREDTYSIVDDDDDYVGEVIGDYHTARRIVGHIPSREDRDKPKLLMGLELEVEVDRDEYLRVAAQRVLDAIGKVESAPGVVLNYAACEDDGSLDYGFEIVTGYTGLSVHRPQLKKLLLDRAVTKALKSHNTSTCGLHVHIDKMGMTALHQAKLSVFINAPENRALIEAIARRYNSGYCKIKPKSVVRERVVIENFDFEERYEAVNFVNDRTVEFRLFRGSLRYEAVIAALEFTRMAWLFAFESSAMSLTTEAFIKFIEESRHAAETKYLRWYLNHRGVKVRTEGNPLVIEKRLAAGVLPRATPVADEATTDDDGVEVAPIIERKPVDESKFEPLVTPPRSLLTEQSPTDLQVRNDLTWWVDEAAVLDAAPEVLRVNATGDTVRITTPFQSLQSPPAFIRLD